MSPITIRYLSGPDITALEMSPAEILAAQENCLKLRGTVTRSSSRVCV